MKPAWPVFRSAAVTFLSLGLALAILWVFTRGRSEYGLLDLLRGRRLPTASILPHSDPGGDGSASQAEHMEALSREFVSLVRQVLPSVVSVHTSKERAFRMVTVLPDGVDEGEQQFISQPGVGSGVIVSENGHIITNYHVIRDLDLTSGRDQLYVTLHGEDQPRAVVVVGSSKNADIAVLQLKESKGRTFPALKFGDSDQLHMGQIVLAFGSPFGLAESVTQGIISKTQRRLGDAEEGSDYIQTDAAINPGNSGGPLVNLRGEIIGINWALYSGQSEVHVFQGVSLAQPANDVKEAYENLIHKDRKRGYIGLSLINAPAFGEGKGAQISAMDRGSPAAEAGLKPGDVILKIDDVEIVGAADADKRLQKKNVGESASFAVRRSGEELQPIAVTVADANDISPATAEMAVPALKLSIKDGEVSDFRLLRERGWSHGRQFVLVTQVEKSSPLTGKIQAGDVIRAIDGNLCLTTEEFANSLKASPNGQRKLNVWRNYQTVFSLPLPGA